MLKSLLIKIILLFCVPIISVVDVLCDATEEIYLTLKISSLGKFWDYKLLIVLKYYSLAILYFLPKCIEHIRTIILLKNEK